MGNEGNQGKQAVASDVTSGMGTWLTKSPQRVPESILTMLVQARRLQRNKAQLKPATRSRVSIRLLPMRKKLAVEELEAALAVVVV